MERFLIKVFLEVRKGIKKKPKQKYLSRRVARCFVRQYTKTWGKYIKLPRNCEMTVKYTYIRAIKYTKIYVSQMAIIYTNIFHSKALQNLHILVFLV
jgi:hypothetical protein